MFLCILVKKLSVIDHSMFEHNHILTKSHGGFFHEKIVVKYETCDIATTYKLSFKSCLFMVCYIDVCVWCISSIITVSCTCMDEQNWMYMIALLKYLCFVLKNLLDRRLLNLCMWFNAFLNSWHYISDILSLSTQTKS